MAPGHLASAEGLEVLFHAGVCGVATERGENPTKLGKTLVDPSSREKFRRLDGVSNVGQEGVPVRLPRGHGELYWGTGGKLCDTGGVGSSGDKEKGTSSLFLNFQTFRAFAAAVFLSNMAKAGNVV